ncbi:MAG: hypothetical protein V1918_04540 [Planctomycetota bacterium]
MILPAPPKPGEEARIASGAEIPAALALIRQVHGLDLDLEAWQWLQESAPGRKPYMVVVMSEGEVGSASVCYLPNVRLGREICATVGFLAHICSAPGRHLRKQGAAMDLLLGMEHRLPEDGVFYLAGTFSEKLYKRYYRRRLGYSCGVMRTARLYHYDVREYLADFCERAGRMGLSLPGAVLVEVGHPVFESVFLAVGPEGAEVVDAPGRAPDLRVLGTTWPLFRCVTQKQAKRALLNTLFTFRLRFRGVLRHPVKALRFLRLLFRMWRHAEKA